MRASPPALRPLPRPQHLCVPHGEPNAVSVVDRIASLLDRFGVITQERFYPTVGLAWPRVVTGFAIMSKQTVDLALVGIAVGIAGTAGLAFALAYWGLVIMLGLGLASGTISLVSQHYGAEAFDRAARTVNMSVIVAVLLSIPLMYVFIAYPATLIGLLGAEPEPLREGSVYLVLVAPAIVFELLNLIASRTYTGIGDTYTEMVVRATGAGLNVVLSAVLIFGLGLGVAGAAIGTTLSTGVVTLVLAWGMLGRSYGGYAGLKPSPVTIAPGGPWFDMALFVQLLEIAAPEIGRRLAEGIVVFPLLWIAASFGPVIVTAFEVARRIRGLINSANWGLSLASSALVGQHLGANEEDEAAAYGGSIIRLALVVYLVVGVGVIVFAESIAGIFVSGPDAIAQTAIFVVVCAVSAVGQGIDGTATGALVGAGDTRWPFVAAILGRYVFALPAAALGLVTPIGVAGLYLALLLEVYVPGAINYGLFRSGRWKAVSRRYRTTAK